MVVADPRRPRRVDVMRVTADDPLAR